MKQEMVFFAIILVVSLANRADGAKPVYNIGHMVNTRAQIDEWLGYGANAIETDITFAEDGTPEYTYHGIPCDFGRYCLRWDYVKEYIEAIRERTVPSSPKFNPSFVLIMFDLKLSKLDNGVLRNAGTEFADMALIPLFSDESSQLKVICSIENTSRRDFITGLLARLNATRPDIVTKIGFDINSEKDHGEPEDLQEFFKEIGVPHGRMWLSEGITNWFFPVSKNKIIEELEDLVQYKENGDGYISKVYAWTVNLVSTTKSLLETGIDGIITNNPENFLKAMTDFNKEVKHGEEKLRLATLADDPFKRNN